VRVQEFHGNASFYAGVKNYVLHNTVIYSRQV